MKINFTGIAILLIGCYLLYASCAYIVPEGEEGVLLKFGQPVGYVSTAGLHWRAPFVTTFATLPKAQLEWEGEPAEVPTGDRLLLEVVPYARWQISNLQAYYPSLHDIPTGQSRLHDVLLSTLRSTIASYPLSECVRSETDVTKTPAAGVVPPEALKETLEPITVGRKALELRILQTTNAALQGYGIEILSFGLKKTGYGAANQASIITRMTAERTQTGENILAKGEAEAKSIESKGGADAAATVAKAAAKAQEIKGEAEAKAQALYRASTGEPDALQFYTLLLQTDALKKAVENTGVDRSTTLFIEKNNPLLKPAVADPVEPVKKP